MITRIGRKRALELEALAYSYSMRETATNPRELLAALAARAAADRYLVGGEEDLVRLGYLLTTRPLAWWGEVLTLCQDILLAVEWVEKHYRSLDL